MFYCYVSAMYLRPGRLAGLGRWLSFTVTILDRFHCITTHKDHGCTRQSHVIT